MERNVGQCNGHFVSRVCAQNPGASSPRGSGLSTPCFQTLRQGAPADLAPTGGPPPASSLEFRPHAATCQEQGPAPSDFPDTPLTLGPQKLSPQLRLQATSASPPGPYSSPAPDFEPRPRNPGPEAAPPQEPFAWRGGGALRDDVGGRAR